MKTGLLDTLDRIGALQRYLRKRPEPSGQRRKQRHISPSARGRNAFN